MEVTSFEDGLRGSWYAVEILEVVCASGSREPSMAVVKYLADFGGQETVSVERLRPMVPLAPCDDWMDALASGDQVHKGKAT